MIVDGVPGTTRDAVDIRASWRGKGLTLIDTAGIRREGKLREAAEYYSLTRTRASLKRCDAALMLLDALEGVTVQDEKLARSILDEGRGCVLGVNKWDLVRGGDTRRYRETLWGRMRFFNHVPVVFLSAKLGRGIGRSLDALFLVREQTERRVGTPVLNRILHQAWERTPPSLKGKRVSALLRRATGVRPPAFSSSSTTAILADQYAQYLSTPPPRLRIRRRPCAWRIQDRRAPRRGDGEPQDQAEDRTARRPQRLGAADRVETDPPSSPVPLPGDLQTLQVAANRLREIHGGSAGTSTAPTVQMPSAVPGRSCVNRVPHRRSAIPARRRRRGRNPERPRRRAAPSRSSPPDPARGRTRRRRSEGGAIGTPRPEPRCSARRSSCRASAPLGGGRSASRRRGGLGRLGGRGRRRDRRLRRFGRLGSVGSGVSVAVGSDVSVAVVPASRLPWVPASGLPWAPASGPGSGVSVAVGSGVCCRGFRRLGCRGFPASRLPWVRRLGCRGLRASRLPWVRRLGPWVPASRPWARHGGRAGRRPWITEREGAALHPEDEPSA